MRLFSSQRCGRQNKKHHWRDRRPIGFRNFRGLRFELLEERRLLTASPRVTTFASMTLDGPQGLAFDAAGNLYVANGANNTISKVTPAGAISTFVSSGLDYPEGLAFDAAGNLYVANAFNSTISEVTPAPAPLIVTPADWTAAGLTLTLGSDGNLHVYTTDTITDVVPPVAPTSVSNIEITAPSSTMADLTIDSTDGDPIPAGGLTYTGGGGLIITGPGTVNLSGTNSYTGGTTVSDGILLIPAASALPDGTSLTVGAGGTFVFDPSATGASNITRTTTAAPVTTNAVSSSPVSSAATAANVVKSSTSGRTSQSPIVPPVALQPPQAIPAVALGTPAADGLVRSSITKRRAAGDLAWLGQAANSSDTSDQQRKKEVTILALDAVFSQYGR